MNGDEGPLIEALMMGRTKRIDERFRQTETNNHNAKRVPIPNRNG